MCRHTEPHVHVGAHGEITRVLVDTGRGFTDARVVHEGQLGARGRVLKDIVRDIVASLDVPLVNLERRRVRGSGQGKAG